MTDQIPTVEDVIAARERIRGAVRHTPLLRRTVEGREVWFKPEVLQRTGSFKLRGAMNFLASMPADARDRGVVAYSSGNHAQGVAAAAAHHATGAVIVMPSDAPVIKLANTRRLGAEVVEYDRAHESREEIAATIATERQATIVPPFDHPWTIAGQGTAGLELFEDLEAAGVEGVSVVVPASGGGLTAGIALAAEVSSVDASLLTAEPAGHDDHRRSFESGRRVRNDPATPISICDALLQPEPGAITYAVNRDRVAGGVMADDVEVRAAMRYAFETLKLVVEPGGAVALAALLAGRVPGSGPVAVILSGGNVDPGLLSDALG